jgi:hypothetical protein
VTAKRLAELGDLVGSFSSVVGVERTHGVDYSFWPSCWVSQVVPESESFLTGQTRIRVAD